MKAFKKAVALMLCFVMTLGVFAVSGITIEDLAGLFTPKAEAYTNTTIGRITQQQVVGTSGSINGVLARDFWYTSYANGYFDGNSEPTNLVIPGLGDGDDYTPQGMTYWPEKNWVLISAYDASGQSRASCIYAIDVASGKFVALFNLYNADGSVNTSHGGGIAASKHNFYYADSGSKISYVPLSELDVAEGTEKNVTLKGSVNFAGEMNSASTSYCCFDDGVLWTGNFYLDSEDSYKQPANAAHNSMLFGYRLDGDSSQEEWNYLCGKYKNLVNVTTASGTGSNSGANLTWNAYKNGDSVDITGNITAPTAYVGEFCPSFASLNLTEGKSYVIEFISTNNSSDLYIFAPNGGGHTNVKQSTQTTKTQLPDGRWHYQMTFTAGLKPVGADSAWPTTQSTNGTYTGTYTMRFDQDAIQAGETRSFAMTDIGVREANTYSGNEYDYDRIHYVGTVGNPTYVVAFPNNITADIKHHNANIGDTIPFQRIQYAMVDNGRIYVSRSWSRLMANGNHISEIDIIDIDLNVPGTYSLTINGATRNDCYLVADNQIHQFHNLSMGEAVCVIDDYLYMFTESAAYNYRKKNWDQSRTSDNGSTSVATQPVDVVWKIDQYALMGEERKAFSSSSATDSASAAGHVDTYVKVNSLDEINYNDKYIIVYESDVKAANGNKILYALDSFGGYKAGHVPKNSAGTQANTADSLGIVGHPITKYATDGDNLKLNDVMADDKDSLHWNLIGADTGAFRMQNNDSYYGKYKNLYFGSRLIYMMNSEGTTSKLDHIKIKDNGDGTFSFYYKGDADYYLWCNDGTVPAYMDAYDKVYNNTYAFGGDNPETTDTVESGAVKAYAGQVEEAGTFHSDAFAKKTANDSGNKTGQVVNEKYTKFHIYHRDEDTSIAGENGLATNLNAELKDDGTYTITLESYSTGQTITQKSTTGKPIDFVFVLDTSASMTNNSDVPYWGISDYPEPYSYNLASTDGRQLKYGDSYHGLWDNRTGGNWYNGWYWHITNTYDNNGEDYFFTINSNLVAQGSTSEGDMAESYGFKKNPDKGFAGGYYWVDRTGDATRFEALKKSTLDFIQQIQEHAEKTGLQHRIAIVQYGSTSTIDANQYADEGYYNTGMYSTGTGVTMTNYGSLIGSGFGQNNAVYENAFFPANHDNLDQIVNNLSIDGDSDTFVGHGMAMALNSVADQMTLFNKEGDRVGDRIYGTYSKVGNEGGYTEADVNSKAVVINITDGAPGYGGSDGDAAYHASIEALNNANSMKLYDVDIYSVQIGGDSVASFSNADFLDALSSNYINGSATSKYEGNDNTLIKGQANGSGYYIQQNLANKLELDSLFDQISQAGENELLEVETVTLGSDAVTLQSLGDTFMLTNDSVATAKTSQIYYDSLGRIYEEEPVNANYSVTKNVSNNTVQLTGFNYSSEYVAPGNDGKKLILQIDNVLLNPDKEDQFGLNLPISNDTETAIYANSSALSSGTATQYFPQTYFEVPTFNYVYDFGLSMTNSSLYGTPVSFDTLPDKQSPANLNLNIAGDAAIGYNGTTVTSNIAPTCNGLRESFALMKKPNNNGYYWAKVNMIPASNVLYEENVASVSGNGTSWSSLGTPVNANQAVSGNYDIYGYDNAYTTGNNGFSNGAADNVVLDYYSSRSATKTFDFTGDSFDLISACGKKTGVQIVTVRNSAGKIVKVYIVDTYYSDADVISSNNDILYQVPIVSFSGDYDKYNVEVTAVYLTSAMAFRSRNNPVTTYAIDADNEEIEVSATTVSDDDVIAEMLAEAGMEELIGEDVELVWFDDDSIFNGGTGAFLVSEPVTTVESVQMMANDGEQLSCRVIYNWGNDGTFIPDTETLPDSFVFNYTKGQLLTSDDIDSKYKSSTIVEIEGEDGVWKFSGWKIPNNGVIKNDTVEVTGKWTFYPELNYYFDSIRIYNPMQDQSKYIASEQGASYYNVINNLADTENGIFTGVKDVFAYIEGATFGEASFADYQSKGPQNELYLSNGSTGVTFSVNLPAGAKVMLGVRAVSGAPKLTVNGNAIAINSATELYYDITPYLTSANGVANVAITNSGTGLLAVNNMKLVGATTASVSALSLDEARMLMAKPPVDVEYVLPETDGVVAYPGSEPVRDVENPDPDLDPVGEYVITHPDTDGDTDDDGTTDWIEVIIGKVRSFFSDIFGNIKKIFEFIVSSFTEKEVF